MRRQPHRRGSADLRWVITKNLLNKGAPQTFDPLIEHSTPSPSRGPD